MGILHAGILNALSGCQVKAVCEADPIVRKIGGEVLQEVRFYDSPFDMAVEENLDAVYVTAPIASHASIVADLARSGKQLGVFIEKPLASSTKEAQQLVEMASKFASTDMVGFQKRFLPQFMQGKDFLDRGVLGEVVSFRGYAYAASVFSSGRGWRFRRGEGGALLDLGSHLVDLVLWYFGTPVSVAAEESSIYSKEVEDQALVEFEFNSKLSGRIEVSWSKEGYRLPETGLEIVGSNGTLRVSDDILEFNLSKGVHDQSPTGRVALSRPDLARGVEFLLGEPEYSLEDQRFISALRDEKRASPSLYEGLNVNRIIDFAHSSARRR